MSESGQALSSHPRLIRGWAGSPTPGAACLPTVNLNFFQNLPFSPYKPHKHLFYFSRNHLVYARWIFFRQREVVGCILLARECRRRFCKLQKIPCVLKSNTKEWKKGPRLHVETHQLKKADLLKCCFTTLWFPWEAKEAHLGRSCCQIPSLFVLAANDAVSQRRVVYSVPCPCCLPLFHAFLASSPAQAQALHAYTLPFQAQALKEAKVSGVVVHPPHSHLPSR